MAQSILINGEFNSELIAEIAKYNTIAPKHLLEHVSDQLPDLVDNTGSTLLHYAAKFHNFETIRYLLQLGCKNDVFNNEGYTPLMLSALHNHEFPVIILYQCISDTHLRKLLEAIFGCDSISRSIVRLVLEKLQKTDCKVVAKLLMETKCPLYHAICLDRVRSVKIMLDNGYSVDGKDPFDGNSPLHVAVSYRNVGLVRLLLKYGADVNAVNHDGEIPLNVRMLVCHRKKYLEILKILVEQRLKLTSCDHKGRMHIFKITQESYNGGLEILLRSNINYNAQDRYGDTVIHYCASIPYLPVEIFPLLIKNDFNPNIQNNSGHTPLMILSEHAKYKNYFDAMQLLLAKGADVNIKSREGGIPALHNLIRCKREFEYLPRANCIREMLVRYGADIQYVTNDGKTIMDEISGGIEVGVLNIVLFYLVLLETQGTIIIEPIRRKIESTGWIKRRIEFYKSELKHLKTIEIYESVTIFKLLVCNKMKFRSYLRNKQLATKMQHVLKNNIKGVDCMYIEILKIRMEEASNIIEWQPKAEIVFCKLVDDSVRFPDLIFNELMNYLNVMDLKNLAAVKCYTRKRQRPDSDDDTCKRKC